jgi:TonB-linked SusC/RagA family outer membrane protein
LNYAKTFADIHKINILVGTEAIFGQYRDLNAGRNSYPYGDDINYRTLNAGGGGVTNSGGISQSTLYSLFAKVNYILNDKYIVDATIRRDGSSRFGPENRYAVFPAFSLGWRLNQESFMSGITWLTDLKLRGGWGQMGNQDISNENAYTTFRSSIDQSYYDIKGSGAGGIAQGFDAGRFGNPGGKWETTTQTNIGFDATLFNKLTLNFDWYSRLTSDMLYQLPQPATRGVASLPYQNVGEMSNKGIDIMLSYNGQSANGDFKYSIGANWSTYKNEVVKISSNANEVLLGPDRRQYIYTRAEDGHPISSFYGLIIDGFTDGSESYDSAGELYSKVYPGYYNYADGKGRFKYRDVDGDGVLDATADRTFIGNPHPKFIYGLNFSASYKNFDFTLFLQGVSGNDVINYVRRWTDFNNFQGNRSMRFYADSWTPELGDAALLPILSQNDDQSQQPSTYFVEKGSYLRCKNFQIGYTIPNLKGIDRLRLYFQTTNLFTITKYSGLDPEINIQYGNNNNLGWDEGLYPTARNFIFGVNFGL